MFVLFVSHFSIQEVDTACRIRVLIIHKQHPELSQSARICLHDNSLHAGLDCTAASLLRAFLPTNVTLVYSLLILLLFKFDSVVVFCLLLSQGQWVIGLYQYELHSQHLPEKY